MHLTGTQRLADAKKGLNELEELHDELLTLSAEGAAVPEDASDEDLKQFVDDKLLPAIEKAEATIDAARLAKKKHNSYLSSSV
jgi:SRSO17 transposase